MSRTTCTLSCREAEMRPSTHMYVHVISRIGMIHTPIIYRSYGTTPDHLLARCQARFRNHFLEHPRSDLRSDPNTTSTISSILSISITHVLFPPSCDFARASSTRYSTYHSV